MAWEKLPVGTWASYDPVQVFVEQRVYRNWTRVRRYRGRVYRTLEDGTVEREDCGCYGHAKRSAAKRCAEKLARRLNRGRASSGRRG